ncbi:hypothetical protein JD844_027608 [Phrynosoma platyrhinos]|uniref:Reelin n=1 Tax=Phrynosoma platyrhinos TaxID=52577 RepID=A0ABQ7SGJ4_PHRPL|nr:hypothetical protein JD844_027608 [Phrynosoma platyrhinos]
MKWDIVGAIVGPECGTLESGSSVVFLRDGERKLCTPYMDTTGYGNLRFYFSMGDSEKKGFWSPYIAHKWLQAQGSKDAESSKDRFEIEKFQSTNKRLPNLHITTGGICDAGQGHENDVILYAKIEGRKDHLILDTMTYASYRVPSLVSVVISPELQTPATKFCLKQKNHQGRNKNVWAVDYFHVLPVLPSTVTHMIQFSINLGCGTHQPGNSVSLEFSTNHGRTWSLLHSECLPEICAGSHLPHSTIYASENYSG